MIPVHGQESLAFRWKARPASQQVAGQFRGRAIQSLKRAAPERGGREAELLRNSWSSIEESMALFLASLNNFDSFCEGPRERKALCRSSTGLELTWEFTSNEALAVVQLNDQTKMHLRLLDPQVDGLRRFEFFIYELPVGPQSRPTLGLELFANNCERP